MWKLLKLLLAVFFGLTIFSIVFLYVLFRNASKSRNPVFYGTVAGLFSALTAFVIDMSLKMAVARDEIISYFGNIQLEIGDFFTKLTNFELNINPIYFCVSILLPLAIYIAGRKYYIDSVQEYKISKLKNICAYLSLFFILVSFF